jgi:hypothetical protein
MEERPRAGVTLLLDIVLVKQPIKEELIWVKHTNLKSTKNKLGAMRL